MDSQTTAPQTAADRAGMVGQDTKQAASDVASTAGQEAKRTTREAKDQARQLMSQARSELTDQASSQQTRAADGLRQLADQLGSMAQASDDGMAKGLVEDVSRRAHDAASWLDQRDPGSILQEARDFARRRPGTFLAVAAGLGVLGGRLSRSLVEEAKDDSGPSTEVSTTYGTGTAPISAMGNGSTTDPTYGSTTGTGSLAATGVSDAGMPSATSPTYGTTTSVPVTPGAGVGAVGEGTSTVPSGDLPGEHRTSQPLEPDGTAAPIDREGRLTTLEDDIMTRGER